MNNQASNGKGISKHSTAALSLAALGVVFGDIGTSPLYAVRECFHGDYAVAVTKANIFGVLSLMFWSLILVVTLKYLTFVMRADNNGEGGVMALTSLVNRLKGSARPLYLVALGLFAAALLYGDGMVTPAISVLSALEGLELLTPAFQPYIIPATVLILAGLFLIQSKGTARVGGLFGPVVLVWFITLAALGIVQILHQPSILAALSPHWGVHFLFHNGSHGFLVLGAVFLVVTGAEALYADMGHFGAFPIRLVWYGLVLPALVLNYLGQGALLLTHQEHAHQIFFSMVPAWGRIPILVLATIATIIASQAVITGAFSLTYQAIQLGYLPRLKVVHTSAKQMGQIYVPVVNWILMIATIGLVIGFKTSSRLAAAYGVAVTSTMLVTTMLFYVVARNRWHWKMWQALSLSGVFFIADLAFFGANVVKILHGAWFPLAVGLIVYLMLITWKKGRKLIGTELKETAVPLEQFRKSEAAVSAVRVRGQALFLAGTPGIVPHSLIHNVEHNHVLHNQIVLLHFRTLNVPRVPNDEKIELKRLGGGFSQAMVHYGFVERPNFDNLLSLLRGQGLELDEEDISVFMGRQKIIVTKKPGMSRWRKHLFVKLSESAQDAALFFNIPADKIIEVGVPLEL
ncbi:MAG: potassium transporter Kup [Acidobacteria bacterium]|nr:potassium transporter Kup [Acidobacteriota bacterium]